MLTSQVSSCSFVFEISVLHTRVACAVIIRGFKGGRKSGAQQVMVSLLKRPVNWKEGVDSLELSSRLRQSIHIRHACIHTNKINAKIGVWLDGLVYKRSCISPYL